MEAKGPLRCLPCRIALVNVHRSGLEEPLWLQSLDHNVALILVLSHARNDKTEKKGLRMIRMSPVQSSEEDNPGFGEEPWLLCQIIGRFAKPDIMPGCVLPRQ